MIVSPSPPEFLIFHNTHSGDDLWIQEPCPICNFKITAIRQFLLDKLRIANNQIIIVAVTHLSDGSVHWKYILYICCDTPKLQGGDG